MAWIRSVLESQTEDAESALAARVRSLEDLAKSGFRAPIGFFNRAGAQEDQLAESVRIYQAIALDMRNPLKVRADAFYMLRWFPDSARTEEIAREAVALPRSLSRGSLTERDRFPIHAKMIAALHRLTPKHGFVMHALSDSAVSGETAPIRYEAARGLSEFQDWPEAVAVLERLRQFDPSPRVRDMAQKALDGKAYG